MTFDKEVFVKLATQFSDHPFDRGDGYKAFLELRHTEWTYLAATYETHWGDPLTNDASKLGHSAAKIGQKGPSNIKKPEYYPSTCLSYTVLDGRMLGYWG